MPDIKKIDFNDKQLEAINSMKKGCNSFFFEGGVRSGKSVLAAWMIDYICSHTPGMEAYIYRDTFESIRKDTHRIMEDKPGFLNGKGVWKFGHKEFHYNNGSRIFFQYTKGGKHTLGQTAGLIYFEQVESISETDYDMISSRLSQWGPAAKDEYMKRFGNFVRAGKMLKPKNYFFMSANPKANWVKGRYIDTYGLADRNKIIKNDDGTSSTILEVQDKLKNEGITRFHFSTYDNIHNLGDEYLKKVETSSDAYKKQFYDGSWEFNTGLIYPEFNNSDYEDGGNVVNFEWEVANNFNPKNLRTIVAVDPGYVKSKFAAVFCAILPDNTYYFFDELVANGKNAEEWDKIGPTEFAKRLKQKYQERGFTPSSGIIDSAAHNENSGMGSVSGQFLKAGISLKSAKKTKEYGTIMAIKDLLKGRKILVNARCQELIKEFGLWAWDERKVTNGDQKPLDEDNDMLDCCRYIVNEVPHPLSRVQSYSEIIKNHFDGENLYKGWVKTWYGKKEKKPNLLNINNKDKKSWGI
jgi:hypothetical protein